MIDGLVYHGRYVAAAWQAAVDRGGLGHRRRVQSGDVAGRAESVNEALPFGRVQGPLPGPRSVHRAGRDIERGKYMPLMPRDGRQLVGRVAADRAGKGERGGRRGQVGGQRQVRR